MGSARGGGRGLRGPLLGASLAAYRAWHERRWIGAAEEPAAAQRRVLRAILREGSDTSFGREHGYATLASVADYRRAIPARKSRDFKPYLERVFAGEARVLTREAPLFFNQTSGTTGESKHIPVTRTLLRRWQERTRLWLALAARDHERLFDHGWLALVGRGRIGKSPVGVPFGMTSGTLRRATSRRLDWIYALPADATQMEDYEPRMFVIARLALSRRLSLISVQNPGTVLRLADTLERRSEELIGAIRDGRLGIEAGASANAEVLRRLGGSLAPDPGRAAELEAVRRSTGALRPGGCWPDVKLVGTWLAGTVGLQAARLAPLFGQVPFRDLGYLAAEGQFSLPLEDGAPDGVLDLFGAYYEFVPEEASERPDPPVVGAEDLEPGRRYAVIVSTPGGLARYDMEDIVEVTGHWRRAPRIRFVRKSRDYADLGGEKMCLPHFIAATERVVRESGLTFAAYRFVPDYAATRYLLLIEPDRGASGPRRLPELADVVVRVDAALGDVNRSYARMQRSGRLGRLALRVMRAGWSEAERRRYADRGKSDAQFKWRVMADGLEPEDRDSTVAMIEPQGSAG